MQRAWRDFSGVIVRGVSKPVNHLRAFKTALVNLDLHTLPAHLDAHYPRTHSGLRRRVQFADFGIGQLRLCLLGSENKLGCLRKPHEPLFWCEASEFRMAIEIYMARHGCRWRRLAEVSAVLSLRQMLAIRSTSLLVFLPRAELKDATQL